MDVAATVDQPIAPMTLREHIAAEEPAKALPGIVPAVSQVDATPDPDVEASPELATEIDTLEAPKAEETPQEKAARTKRHKSAAQRGLVSRLANQRDRERDRAATAERERDELRQRLQTPPAAREGQPAQPVKAGTPAVYDGRHPNDPEPTEDTFANDPDPFRAHERAHADWRQRKQLRQVHYGQQQASLQADAHARRVDAIRAFDTHATELRKAEPGFDAAIEHLDLTVPMQAVIFGSGELGPHIALALAKDSAAYQRIAALKESPQALIELGAFKATVGLARKSAAESPTPVTQAPAPPSQTAGGAAAAAEPDTRKGVPLKDHIRIEEAEIADRQRRGYRY